MSNRYVDVSITRNTQIISVAGSGLSLIVSLEGAKDYAEYASLEDVKAVHAETTETYKLARAILNHAPKVEKVAIVGIAYDVDADTPDTVVDAIEEIVKAHPDFMFLHTTSTDSAVITAISNYNKANERIYVATTDSVELVATLKENDNTFLVVTKTPTNYTASAAIGAVSPYEIGNYTLTFTNLPEIEADTWTDSELLQIEQGASAYIREGGVNIISKGVTTSGEYLDIILGQYWLKSRITEEVYRVLTTHQKVSFTNAGIALIVASLEGVLKQGATNGVIALDDAGNPMYTLSIPDVANITPANKSNRILPDIDWNATIDGAIEKVQIRGVLSL